MNAHAQTVRSRRGVGSRSHESALIGTVQAFALGRSLCLQFHPEVTNEIMDMWVGAYRHELDEHAVDPDVGPAGQYVSAYYLSRWGNDEARDNNGTVIPDC